LARGSHLGDRLQRLSQHRDRDARRMRRLQQLRAEALLADELQTASRSTLERVKVVRKGVVPA
jgi:hypothetical protein